MPTNSTKVSTASPKREGPGDAHAPKESVPAQPGDHRNPAIVYFIVILGVATLLLVKPWILLFKGAAADRLYSYAILIPVISGWLLWSKRTQKVQVTRASAIMGIFLLIAAVVCALAGIYFAKQGRMTNETTWLSTQIAAWVLSAWGAAFLSFGHRWVLSNLFPVLFLLFTIPMPQPMVEAVEYGLQHASAEVSHWLFGFAGTPHIREGLNFWFPNVHIAVAPECSGIRSTLVLFVTGILGSHLLLRRFHNQCILVAAIIPLGILRNAIRIITLTLLSVHVDPSIMDSPLHHRGGPFFFAISLVPLFALFWWLARRERQSTTRHP